MQLHKNPMIKFYLKISKLIIVATSIYIIIYVDLAPWILLIYEYGKQ